MSKVIYPKFPKHNKKPKPKPELEPKAPPPPPPPPKQKMCAVTFAIEKTAFDTLVKLAGNAARVPKLLLESTDKAHGLEPGSLTGPPKA
jgi:hypothetical protein